ncbi:hypothetical protein [Trinickia mobilis]|uniref:hypothetical protein n=1 Tax=Trinickia mobilis TaxID=2816356 RepID=UPI001A8EA198|nr:hypothetical protein [Trinickia mobilis]
MDSLFQASATTWAAIVGSGVFHGVNPAMGWLFATALGMQRGSRAALLMALAPLALGHAAAILLFTASAAALGTWRAALPLHLLLGALLIGWAVYRHRYGHRHRVRVGMTAGFAGLAAWSAAMATLHGAGLMLMPVMLPLCGSGFGGAAGLLVPLQFTVVHTAVTLVTTAIAALAAYETIGLGVLRRGWINFDWLWCGALATTGAVLIASG